MGSTPRRAAISRCFAGGMILSSVHRRAARRMANDHDRPLDPDDRLRHRQGVVVEPGIAVRARQVDGDRAMAERLKPGDHRRQFGGAAERAVN
jgi:hypothetical protein